ncbi:hypothetical protein HBH53_150690 [Parastagonospora nodorum]|nr:hypothetical protein HBH53_150690 [Parastagonospora nodorum]KAH3981076.1 hypothetical protein HBH52_082130 [Parastagonospora nodorum]KAH4027079.1 hypothetical protein HBI09_147890 [Parastagonospora nodorum]KAH4118337.1 hypothetical protein HBH47_142660 [Parastagonospora nodorum]KAH4162571.1 hypothetical protein HBH43_161420 [Parastagonospora nodorum]
MAQPVATVPVRRLIPICPQEISMMVLEHLEIVDLVTLYCLNSTWTAVFDSEDNLREKMFRPPKEKDESHADDAERAAWVQEQWNETYKKIEDSEHTPEDFWAHIRLNPYIKSRPVHRDSRPDSIEDTYLMRGDPYSPFVSRENPTSQYPKLPQGHETQAKALLDSMFVSYPPVTRTELHGYIFGWFMMGIPHKKEESSESWEESTGYKMGQVFDIARRQLRDVSTRTTSVSTCTTSVNLWPEMLWQIKLSIPLEDDEEEEEEASRSDDVTRVLGVNEGQGVVEGDAEDAGEENRPDEVIGSVGVLEVEEYEEEEEIEASEHEEGSEYEPQSGSDDSD